MPRILIVDDDDGMRESLTETLTDLGYVNVLAAASGPEALAIMDRFQVDAILLDLRMPKMDGIEVLTKIRERSPALPVVVLTAFATAANTIEAMRLGAYDHLMKPIGRQELADVVNRMLADRRLSSTEIGTQTDTLIGTSGGMRAVQKSIGMLADKDTTVLILGETGTGKELVATALHAHGRRAAAAFIPVNCAAIPADLLESELFGHTKGSFTGAISDRRGAFREADKGTLFLDEIGDMPLAMQAKMLRALEERVITPVGGKPTPVDVRVIAATHHDLGQLVANKRFREDLYYRLNVVPITLPPLRERRADIALLAQHFLALKSNLPKRLSSDAFAKLETYSWPGNIRQLRNVIERASALVRGPIIEPSDLELPTSLASSAKDSDGNDLSQAVAELERKMIERTLADTHGNRTEAARRLGINRQLLYTKMQRYGLMTASDKLTPDVADDDR
ncbi:sigma-54 dependent transcriptional regulator [Methylocella sp. CPCC 101449]|uniref:sigma-54-dependent transcriptional regulator n=1 Tax=Methylocella sp. CPCC 101449 TaxID=2987531 RepID=UPI00289290EB|nr:sigma-54 dependent transcriptional regulator [Methylocella sp. CPCC 101449]MDT2021249.1 sigma-54 dependent transcriptional regulator [Methylocella sp. CPCC 101449]